MDHQVKIGYSFWGFLGPGITDTPDGGRSHRRPFIDGIIAADHEVVFLQPNRDLTEAGDHIADSHLFDAGLPPVDVLFLEWRWPISGRNTTICGSPGHTCDLHRQNRLLYHYTHRAHTPTVIWDKDRQLPAHHPVRQRPNVVVCEATLTPRRGTVPLLFPLDDVLLDAADPVKLAQRERPNPLCYIGNQHGRNAAFDRYFAPAAARTRHLIAGKWTHTSRWPNLNFIGRVPFTEVASLYGQSLATVLLLPDRYAAAGQMTQRIFEAVLAGCLPLAPATINRVHMFVPPQLIVNSGGDTIRSLHWLDNIRGSHEHVNLLAACLERLELFRLSRQLQNLNEMLAPLTANRDVQPAGGRS
ncbi:glycosyltransferase family protein [Nonomuraea cavernae]|uniref:glycosyltransferase family protein n=1 Tax=Nonomuraea cavernae TaxID=2045107 RepID=UPI0033C1DA0F